jgi:hypothetical protein
MESTGKGRSVDGMPILCMGKVAAREALVLR